MLVEFDRFTKIYVSEDFCECLVNSSQLTPSPLEICYLNIYQIKNLYFIKYFSYIYLKNIIILRKIYKLLDMVYW